MVDFWSNHLHISTSDDKVYTHHYGYNQLLRQHALGRFEDLLVAASTHPAMSLYLDNFRSTRNAPNENQGRELLELHTVGSESGYTEDMVKDSAKLLSGFTLNWGGDCQPVYDHGAHTTGPVTVLGFTHPNASADGRYAAECLPALPGHPPGDRAQRRAAAGREVRQRPAVPGAGRPPRPGVPRLRHRHQDDPAGLDRAPGVPGLGRAPR